jgi:hypothetical protein
MCFDLFIRLRNYASLRRLQPSQAFLAFPDVPAAKPRAQHRIGPCTLRRPLPVPGAALLISVDRWGWSAGLAVRSSQRQVCEERLRSVTLSQETDHTLRKVGRGVEGALDVLVRDLLRALDVEGREKLHGRRVVLQERLVQVRSCQSLSTRGTTASSTHNGFQHLVGAQRPFENRGHEVARVPVGPSATCLPLQQQRSRKRKNFIPDMIVS